MEWYRVYIRIQSECRKIRTRKISVFEHFSRSENLLKACLGRNQKLQTIKVNYCTLWRTTLVLAGSKSFIFDHFETMVSVKEKCPFYILLTYNTWLFYTEPQTVSHPKETTFWQKKNCDKNNSIKNTQLIIRFKWLFL